MVWETIGSKGMFQVLYIHIYLIFITILWGRYYNSHRTEEEIGTEGWIDLPKISQ